MKKDIQIKVGVSFGKNREGLTIDMSVNEADVVKFKENDDRFINLFWKPALAMLFNEMLTEIAKHRN